MRLAMSCCVAQHQMMAASDRSTINPSPPQTPFIEMIEADQSLPPPPPTPRKEFTYDPPFDCIYP